MRSSTVSTKKSALSAACHTGPSLHLSPETRSSTSGDAKSSPDASLIVASVYNAPQLVPFGSSVPDLLGAKRESIPIGFAADKSMTLAANAPSTATNAAAASAAARARSAIPITRVPARIPRNRATRRVGELCYNELVKWRWV